MTDIKFSLFVTIYNVVKYIYKNKKITGLEKFLSDADPFFWDDEGSFDPALYNDFANEMHLNFDYSDEGYETMIEYFNKLDNYYIETKRVMQNLSEAEYNEIITHFETDA